MYCEFRCGKTNNNKKGLKKNLMGYLQKIFIGLSDKE